MIITMQLELIKGVMIVYCALNVKFLERTESFGVVACLKPPVHLYSYLSLLQCFYFKCYSVSGLQPQTWDAVSVTGGLIFTEPFL